MSTAPLATYRLQLGPDLTFADAVDLVGYLADLGVSHLYLSPLLTATAGSTHGYDVADPTTVSAVLGGEPGLRALAAAARSAGLGLVVDIVPNHAGVSADNPLWEDLLAHGQRGEGGRAFDVDWNPALPGAAGKVVLPVLGDQYGKVLHAGELALAESDGAVRVGYYDNSFPISPESREKLARSGGVAALAGTPGQPESWTRLHALLEEQHYRLLHWRAGDALINYRRFFAINDLAALRVEDPHVFDVTHARILALVDAGVVDGLRIDHPDGLRDPRRYLQRLADATGGAWTVVEKILHSSPTHPEPLPDWPVAGTTGYEFANDVLGLFVDGRARGTLHAVDRDFGAPLASYAERAAEAKGEVLAADLAADVRRLARRLWALTQSHLEVRDVDDRACLEVLTRTLKAIDVYRTYVDPETGAASAEDVARVEAAVGRGRQGSDAPGELFDFLAAVLVGRAGTSPAHLDVLARFQQLSGAVTAKGVEDTVFYRVHRLAAVNEVGGDPERLGVDPAAFHAANVERSHRFPTSMLTTATHDTKRGEDVRLRMAALSEMAGRWREEVSRWHELNADAVAHTPRGPAPDPQTALLLYQTLVGVWPVGADPAQDQRAALLDRLRQYAVKAAREAKLRTTWTDPDAAFEDGLARFLDTVLDPARSAAFLRRLAAVACWTGEVAMTSGLAQVLLRCTAPGVPDTYQGGELWDTNLVDPDNRRPVDFALRRRLLAQLRDADPAALLRERRDGRVKLWVLSRALRARRDHAACVGADASYVPLEVTGRHADHVVAFARRAPDTDACLLTVAPRLPGALMRERSEPATGEVWADTAVRLPEALRGAAWRDLLAGAEHASTGRLSLADVLRTLPVALLARR